MPELGLFAGLGDITTLPGRSINGADLAAVDILLVRSVTRVDEKLLAGSPVRFVGSATIGTDHVDTGWLADAGIRFAHAPGCNAMAVAEYVLQAVLHWSLTFRRPLSSCSAGLVGLGNVGARVAELLLALGLSVVATDPPRQRRGDVPGLEWKDLDTVLDCDIVSLHVPLIHSGPDATWHLINEARLGRLRPEQLLVNTCRGDIIDSSALLLQRPEVLPTLVLDVWEGEPRVPALLFQRALLGSPHVAGYSVEGKQRGTRMVHSALLDWLEGAENGSPAVQGACEGPAEAYSGQIMDHAGLLMLLQQNYRIEDDHQLLKQALGEADPVSAFDRLRRDYRPRHEVANLVLTAEVAPSLVPVLRLLGVRFSGPDSLDTASDVPASRRPDGSSLR
ncbi:MAG: erythronate-4-phosphate dehydrogenase [Gammaproteobacteria bacterium HGW-Gammaproteobacteria-14]|nr:MAG: erythronate-4-phosphate dehydrogenase [Gammaproteobacteria bacterium HGW-Gammaproteobacteria-14]